MISIVNAAEVEQVLRPTVYVPSSLTGTLSDGHRDARTGERDVTERVIRRADAHVDRGPESEIESRISA